MYSLTVSSLPLIASNGREVIARTNTKCDYIFPKHRCKRDFSDLVIS